MCWWGGKELFALPRVQAQSVVSLESLAPALVLAVLSHNVVDVEDVGTDRKRYTVTMALILVDDCLGWTPIGWLHPLDGVGKELA